MAELARTTPREIATLHVGNTWSIQENLGHLGDLEPLWDGRLDDLLAGRDVLRAADLANRATHEANHDAARLDELVARFRGRRNAILARLRAFTPADLERTARHPRLGQPMTVVELCHFVAEHDDHHLGRAAELAAFLHEQLRFTVARFAPHWQDAVAALVLGIQNDELGLGLTLADQPDLADVGTAFAGSGLFLLALSGSGELVGCGGLEPLGSGDGVVRKMYVRAGWRGAPPGVAQRLYDDLLAHARRLGLRRLLLDAPESSPAARRFYERQGFRERSRDGLPDGCHFVAQPARVYELLLLADR
jgi:ribosomal protein S18 acetylase RimI-like enzyme